MYTYRLHTNRSGQTRQLSTKYSSAGDLIVGNRKKVKLLNSEVSKNNKSERSKKDAAKQDYLEVKSA